VEAPMGRVTNDGEACPDRQAHPKAQDRSLSHVWELAEDVVVLHVCAYCGTERLSRWIDKESESDNRKENES
jgi:hypothetical protein